VLAGPGAFLFIIIPVVLKFSTHLRIVLWLGVASCRSILNSWRKSRGNVVIHQTRHFEQCCRKQINDILTSTPPLWLDWHSIRCGETSNSSPSHNYLRCTTSSKNIKRRIENCIQEDDPYLNYIIFRT
jgi:hypothetical protein